jgi:integrase
MLGYRGHFATKSRRYSTTMRALRAARREWVRRQQPTARHESDSTVITITDLQWAGRGWRTTGDALLALSAALVARSADHFEGWGNVVIFAACTAARIGEVSGIRCADIDRDAWTWTVRRQTTPSPGGLIDKGTKGKRARTVPLIEEVRPLIERRLDAVGHDPAARIFTGPRGGRITTAVLRDATHWDEVVTQLGYEHLRRHDLRHTGLTWMADAGVPVHVLRKIAGHGSLVTNQRYLHPDAQSIAPDRELVPKWSPATAGQGQLKMDREDTNMPADLGVHRDQRALRCVGTAGFEPATP